MTLNIGANRVWESQKPIFSTANLALKFGSQQHTEEFVSTLFNQLLKDQFDEEAIAKATRFANSALRGRKNRKRLAELGPIDSVKEIISRSLPRKKTIATNHEKAYAQIKKEFTGRKLVKALEAFARSGRALIQDHSSPTVMRGLELAINQIVDVAKSLSAKKSQLLTDKEKKAQIVRHENKDYTQLIASFSNLYQRLTADRRVGVGIEPLGVLIQKVGQLGDEASVEQRAQLYMHVEELWSTAVILQEYLAKLHNILNLSKNESYNSFLLDLEII